MRTEHLKYFLSLAETGSITQTGKELYTSHQNISKIMRQLEEDLGTTLFLRTPKGIELTATGKLFLSLAQRTLNDFSKFRTNILALEKRDDIFGKLHIFSSELVNLTILSSILQIFAELYPSLHIHLENKEPREIFQKIALHPALIGVVAVLNNPEFRNLYAPYIQQVQLTPLIQDTYYCIVHKSSPLADYKSISLAEFSTYPFAATNLNEDEESILTKLVTSYGGHVAFSSNNLSAYHSALLSGRYVSITSSLTHQKNLESDSRSNQLLLIPFQENMQLSISLAVHQHAQLDDAGKAFVEFMKSSDVYL